VVAAAWFGITSLERRRRRALETMNSRHIVATLSMLVLAGGVAANDVEPRRWTPLPIGTTVVGLGLIRGEGDVAFDPLLRLTDATVETTTTELSVVHAFDLFGQTARFDVRVPQQHALWEGLLDGAPRTRDVRGLADPRLRLSVNFIGAPALSGTEFQAYRAAHPVNTVVGAALAVTLPVGEYQDDKLLNLGNHRFAITPQLGAVHIRGPWSYELTGSVSFFTDNRDFLSDKTREQDPVFALQAHVVYATPGGWFASLGAAYDWGGESAVDGATKDDYRETLFYGGSAGIAIDRRSSVQIAYVGRRTQTDIGSDTDNLGLGYSIRF
jgi:hypothetical protein